MEFFTFPHLLTSTFLFGTNLRRESLLELGRQTKDSKKIQITIKPKLSRFTELVITHF
jgi:hypothetical protein